MPYITELLFFESHDSPEIEAHWMAYFRVSKYLLNRCLDVYGLLGQVEGFTCLKLDLQFLVLKGEHLESTKIPLNPPFLSHNPSIERHHISLSPGVELHRCRTSQIPSCWSSHGRSFFRPGTPALVVRDGLDNTRVHVCGTYIYTFTMFQDFGYQQ